MINISYDSEHIATLTIDMPGQSVNTMNQAFQHAFAASVKELYEKRASLRGVIIASAKSTFFAGGDLKELLALGQDQASRAQCYAMLMANHRAMRALETIGRPVVAAINGSALGGGLELALCCHYRVCLNAPKLELAFPEVTLGLLPGAGGVVRTVRMLGMQNAMPYLSEGKKMRPADALAAGFVHELVAQPQDLLPAARALILRHALPDAPAEAEFSPNCAQAWDQKGWKLPGGAPNTPATMGMQQVAPAMLYAKTRGNYPAPAAILAAMVEGAQVDFDNALQIEARYFTSLACGQVAKNMIGAFFFQMQEVQGGKSRPTGFEKRKAAKVGILGAGMMGAGIAWANASRGIPCVLQDVSMERAEQGKAYSARLLEKQIKQGRKTADDAAKVLALITPACEPAAFDGCDLLIEAVFEDLELKQRVSKAALPYLAKDGLFASNTSTLPISSLAEAVEDQANFIGLHFFSPVDKMQLVEIIRGRNTSDAAVARAFDYVLQIGKLPILVNDARGFFTSRVFGSFVQEGIAMLGEGVPAAQVEQAALQAGMPVGPLAVQDEVSLSLTLSIARQAEAAGDQSWQQHPAFAVIKRMTQEFGRKGKAAGAGFYCYPEQGKKYLWPELAQHFGRAGEYPMQDLRDRILYIQSLETLRCLEEGVLMSARDANIGSLFGIGFPAWSGGAIQFVQHVGAQAFVARAKQLQQQYGERFAPPQILQTWAEQGKADF
ncbi:3-hydroxyacyl-CoA dehydrogenase NAD-binding domain-containing protein [Massilia sp. W12]|uniref:3-hydroxyacyl-CoA dehydrogenase NAD-binding domain-containing protein n=1 Tax=Massilia sp. W12 TaxID=3126507 RepID=UPI0030D23770